MLPHGTYYILISATLLRKGEKKEVVCSLTAIYRVQIMLKPKNKKIIS
jgi:hypothetical protein